jgi:hypothetical protein
MAKGRMPQRHRQQSRSSSKKHHEEYAETQVWARIGTLRWPEEWNGSNSWLKGGSNTSASPVEKIRLPQTEARSWLSFREVRYAATGIRDEHFFATSAKFVPVDPACGVVRLIYECLGHGTITLTRLAVRDCEKCATVVNADLCGSRAGCLDRLNYPHTLPALGMRHILLTTIYKDIHLEMLAAAIQD